MPSCTKATAAHIPHGQMPFPVVHKKRMKKIRQKVLTRRQGCGIIPELPCEKSDAYFVLRDGAAGVFLAANTFPKSRETRAPLVEELYRFRDRLPEKLRYLADAPQQDPEGNKTMVRFSRKTKQQYVSSEKDGKATGWSAFYVDGKWVEGKK